MTNLIQLKRSLTTGHVPTSLQAGELAINEVDGKLFWHRSSDDTVQTLDLTLALYALLASPNLSGTPTAPTPTAGDSTTKIATTNFVATAIANLVASSPAALDTLNELAAAIGNDANFSATMITALGNRVRTDTNAQGLTDTQKANARTNIYAAPFDAIGYSGMQVNGSMEVSQENGATLISGINGYALDCVFIEKVGTMVLAAQQVTDAPPGYNNSLKVTVTTAEASMAAGDYATIKQAIEGYRIVRLAFGSASAQPLTIGFWVKANRTGTYSGSVRNATANQSYPFTFVVNAANTWEFKTISVSADTSGTWLTTTNTGLVVAIALACGTTFAGTAGAWAAANYVAATGTTNGVAATSDTFQITGLIVLPGIEVPTSARAAFIMRPYSEELRTCQRHYWKRTAMYCFGFAGAGSAIGQWFEHPVTMRAAPTMSFSGGTASNATGFAWDGSSIDGVRGLLLPVATGVGYFDAFTGVGDARL